MEKETQSLDFKPLTSGLGFHPFSDGLPYAPISQTPNQAKSRTESAAVLASGAGAVAAGRPSFATQIPQIATLTPPKPPARISVPVATHAPVETLTSPVETLITETTYGFGYLFKRACAFLIDSTINILLVLAALSFALLNQEIAPDLLLNPGVVLVSGLFIVLFNWALITAQEVAFGTSIGKRIFRLTLNGPTSAIFLRAFFFLPSLGFLGAGLLWSVIDRKKRCWHDLIVSLQPIEIARL